MSRFEACLDRVLQHEGGYSNHTADRGGATNCGITQAVYDDWRAGRGFGRQPVMGISPDEVRAIYKARYWLLAKCDQLPPPLDYVHFDGAVNHGVTQAGKFLQRALGVEDDGVVGPKTLAAVREEEAAGNSINIALEILQQRWRFYDDLAEKRRDQRVFLTGWHNRLAKISGEIQT